MKSQFDVCGARHIIYFWGCSSVMMLFQPITSYSIHLQKLFIMIVEKKTLFVGAVSQRLHNSAIKRSAALHITVNTNLVSKL